MANKGQKNTNSNDLFQACSIDIGKKNFSFYIEEFDRSKFLEIENIPLEERYNPNGTTTEKMKEILDKIFMNGRTILHKNLDLTKNCDPKMSLDPETFHNMYEVLNEYTEYWDRCSFFIIEEQMSFGRKMNRMAMKLDVLLEHLKKLGTIYYPMIMK